MVELERGRELLKNFGLAAAAEQLDAQLERASHSEMRLMPLSYAAFWKQRGRQENAAARKPV